MGSAELEGQQLVIHSHLIVYGSSASTELIENMREEIETLWNEPAAIVTIHSRNFRVLFRITAELKPDITSLEIIQNLDPINNYFRIEDYAYGNISYVDAIGCNSGYFIVQNLYRGSTTAAHEYGHTIGLDHPHMLDIRGEGAPGIMYPRGTLVDPQFQYEPDKAAGTKGGTMHPMYRRVRDRDILDLSLHRLRFENNKAIVGEFSNVWHEAEVQ